MTDAQPSLFSRNDTFFGICEAIGEDFGFNPIILRLGLGVMLLWNPAIVIGSYLAMGVVILLARLIFPARRRAKADRTIAGEAATPAETMPDMLPLAA